MKKKTTSGAKKAAGKKAKGWGFIRGSVDPAVLASLDGVPRSKSAPGPLPKPDLVPAPALSSEPARALPQEEIQAALDNDSYWEETLAMLDRDLGLPSVHDVRGQTAVDPPPEADSPPKANLVASAQSELDRVLLEPVLNDMVSGLCDLFRDDHDALRVYVGEDGKPTPTAMKARRRLKNQISAAKSSRKKARARACEVESARQRVAAAEARAAAAENAMRQIREALRCAEERREMAERLLAMANARAESAEVALAANCPGRS